MIKKQASIAKTKPAREKALSTTKAAPRVKAAAHRVPGTSAPVEPAPEMVARVAYGYWESRGMQGGDPFEDWIRAEEQLRNVSA